MRREHDGYIMLIVLIYLQLFAMLGLESVANLMIDRKHLGLKVQRISQQNDALRVLQSLDHQDVERCQSLNYSVDTLMRQPLSWWIEHACQGRVNGQEYYYFREIIATYPETYYRHSLRMGMVMVQDTITQQGERLMLRWLR